MGKNPPDVIVVDANSRFLEYTHPGAARILLKSGKASIFSTNPFAIKLNREVDKSSIRRGKSMASQTPRNFTEYFSKERDVYVQNLADAKVSVEFPLSSGQSEGFLFTNSKDPVNLSQYIPFDAIKASMDFRKLLSRRPPVLNLLTEQEYMAYYTRKAQSMKLVNANKKPDVEAAIDLAESKRAKASDKTLKLTNETPKPLHEVVESGSGPGGATMFGERSRVASTEVVTEEEVIKPRVLHLCNQVKAELPEEEKMSAKDLLSELQELSGLTIDDLEYVRSHGYYKTVKKWAKEELAKLAASEEGSDDASEPTEAKA